MYLLGGSPLEAGAAVENRSEFVTTSATDGSGGVEQLTGFINLRMDGEFTLLGEEPTKFCFILSADFRSAPINKVEDTYVGDVVVSVSVEDSTCRAQPTYDPQTVFVSANVELFSSELYVDFDVMLDEPMGVRIKADRLPDAIAVAGADSISCATFLPQANCAAASQRAAAFSAKYGPLFTNKEVLAKMVRIVHLGSLRYADGGLVIPALDVLFPAITRLAVKAEAGDARSSASLDAVVDLALLVDTDD